MLLGNGNGTSQAKTDFATGVYPKCAAIGDLNEDGNLDLATANSNSSTVSVLLGNGDGTFHPKADFSGVVYPTFLVIGDLNGDGRPDLAVSNDGGTVSMLLGDGTGAFEAAPDVVQGANMPLAIGDLNGDGLPDLATLGGSSVLVWMNISPGYAAVGPTSNPRIAALPAPTPNPARSATSITFELPASEPVTLEIVDAAGRLIRTLLAAEAYSAGRHSLRWDGNNRAGRRVASGIYFVRFIAGEHRSMQRIVILTMR